MTLHRAENVDEPSKLKEIFKQLGSIKYIIIFPCHPRTKKNLLANNINLPKNVILVNPITYSEAIYHIHQSVLVISDSGGLPKDAYYLGKRTVEIFHESPWPELKNMNIIILSKPEELAENVNNWINKPMVNLKMPYGDGKATEIIVKEIIESMRY